jgi:hypothetical protein
VSVNDSKIKSYQAELNELKINENN